MEAELLKQYPALVIAGLGVIGIIYFQAKASLAMTNTYNRLVKSNDDQTDAINSLVKAIEKHIEKELMNNAELRVISSEIKELTRQNTELIKDHHVWATNLKIKTT